MSLSTSDPGVDGSAGTGVRDVARWGSDGGASPPGGGLQLALACWMWDSADVAAEGDGECDGEGPPPAPA